MEDGLHVEEEYIRKMKLSIVLTFPDDIVMRRIKAKEEDPFHEAASLMTAKVENTFRREREQFALD